MPGGFLDTLDWNHPAVKTVFDRLMGHAMGKLFPPEPQPDLYREHLLTMLDMIDEHDQTRDRAALVAAAAAMPQVKPPPDPPDRPPGGGQPSRYLVGEGQPGADEAGWDTSCLGCATSHLALTKAMLAKAADAGSPEDRDRYLATARGELAALFAADWTPERIARTPPEHRRIIDRYLGQVRQVQEQISTPYATNAVALAGLASESTRFAFEDGMSHPEVQSRLSKIEELAVEAERVDLGAERLEALPPDQRERAIGLRNRLRRVRQEVRPGVIQDPGHLNAVAAEAERVSRELQHLGATDGARVAGAAREMAALKEQFRAEVAAVAAPKPDNALQVAAQVVGGKLRPDEARSLISEVA